MLKANAALALIALLLPFEANANGFGVCAQHSEPRLKISACIEASRSTSYAWILRWVYRELARAQRERGEIEPALASYRRSLAAQEDATVRREMQELADTSSVSLAIACAVSTEAQAVDAINLAGGLDGSALSRPTSFYCSGF